LPPGPFPSSTKPPILNSTSISYNCVSKKCIEDANRGTNRISPFRPNIMLKQFEGVTRIDLAVEANKARKATPIVRVSRRDERAC